MFPSVWAGILCFILFAGCREEVLQPQFGAPYEIVINEIAGGPDAPPHINGHWLFLTVQYSGGCTDHEFLFESYLRRDTAHVWLNHFSNDDTCEAEILDDLNIELPGSIRDMGVIALYDPVGGPPHLLKW